MTQPRLLTIILNYRTASMTLRSAAAALREMQGIDGEVVIVDNDSGDGSFEALRSHAQAEGWHKNDRLRVIQSGHNGGFGAGNNVGIRAGLSDGTAPDFVYLLNSDAFPQPGAITALINALQADPDIGLAGSYIHGEDGEPHVTAFRFPSIASEFEGAIRFGPITRLLGDHRVPMPVPTESRRVDWLAGASVMLRQQVFDQIGMFDESFFLYFEETDLCLRAHRAGISTFYVRESQVMHIGSVSTGMKQWARVPGYWFDSRLHYFVKNHGRLYAAVATLAHLAGGLLHRLRCLASAKRPSDPPHFLRTLLLHDLAAILPRIAAPHIDRAKPNRQGESQ